MEATIFGILALVFLVLFVLSLRYNFADMLYQYVNGIPDFEETVYVYDHITLPSPNEPDIDGNLVLSDEVFVIDPANNLHIACYNHKHKKWHFFTADENKVKEFKWMYKPKYFKYEKTT